MACVGRWALGSDLQEEALLDVDTQVQLLTGGCRWHFGGRTWLRGGRLGGVTSRVLRTKERGDPPVPPNQALVASFRNCQPRSPRGTRSGREFLWLNPCPTATISSGLSCSGR